MLHRQLAQADQRQAALLFQHPFQQLGHLIRRHQLFLQPLQPGIHFGNLLAQFVPVAPLDLVGIGLPATGGNHDFAGLDCHARFGQLRGKSLLLHRQRTEQQRVQQRHHHRHTARSNQYTFAQGTLVKKSGPVLPALG
jgi:hypothetical protein